MVRGQEQLRQYGHPGTQVGGPADQSGGGARIVGHGAGHRLGLHRGDGQGAGGSGGEGWTHPGIVTGQGPIG